MKSVINCGSVRFLNIPEYFLEKYTDEINAWAKNIRKVGLVKAFVIREGHFSDVSPDPEQGAVLMQVRLLCKPRAGGVEIEPYTPRDEEIISKHCDKMIRLKVPPRAILKEPPRPWIPTMPKIDKASG